MKISYSITLGKVNKSKSPQNTPFHNAIVNLHGNIVYTQKNLFKNQPIDL